MSETVPVSSLADHQARVLRVDWKAAFSLGRAKHAKTCAQHILTSVRRQRRQILNFPIDSSLPRITEIYDIKPASLWLSLTCWCWEGLPGHICMPVCLALASLAFHQFRVEQAELLCRLTDRFLFRVGLNLAQPCQPLAPRVMDNPCGRFRLGCLRFLWHLLTGVRTPKGSIS